MFILARRHISTTFTKWLICNRRVFLINDTMELNSCYYSQENLFVCYSKVTSVTCGDTVCSTSEDLVFHDSGPRDPQRLNEDLECFRITHKPFPCNYRMCNLNMFA